MGQLGLVLEEYFVSASHGAHCFGVMLLSSCLLRGVDDSVALSRQPLTEGDFSVDRSLEMRLCARVMNLSLCMGAASTVKISAKTSLVTGLLYNMYNDGMV